MSSEYLIDAERQIRQLNAEHAKAIAALEEEMSLLREANNQRRYRLDTGIRVVALKSGDQIMADEPHRLNGKANATLVLDEGITL